VFPPSSRDEADGDVLSLRHVEVGVVAFDGGVHAGAHPGGLRVLSKLRARKGRLYARGDDGAASRALRRPGVALLGGVRAMRALVSLGLILGLGLPGCVPQYRPPRADQPHALIKLRRTYETRAGVSLSEALDVDEHAALRDRAPSPVAATPRTDAILAHPVPSTFEVSSNFSHTEARLVHESYQEPHTTYRTESYSCGFGSQTRTCSRSVSHTTYTTRYRTVTRHVEVSDGYCAQALRFSPKDQATYLLQYTYSAHGVCSLACYEQRAREPGGFENQPCPPAPPQKD
jgi:hypothetical protein